MSQRGGKSNPTRLKRKTGPTLTLSRGCCVHINILKPLNKEMEKLNISQMQDKSDRPKGKGRDVPWVTQPCPECWAEG